MCDLCDEQGNPESCQDDDVPDDDFDYCPDCGFGIPCEHDMTPDDLI